MTEQTQTAANAGGGQKDGLLSALPTERLMQEVQGLLRAIAERSMSLATEKVGAATERLTEYADGSASPAGSGAAKGLRALGQGKSPLASLLSAGMGGLTGTIAKAVGGGGGGGGAGDGGEDLKVTNIVEQIDVAAPIDVAYNVWTQFEDFPTFMKKVENVKQESDEKLTWKAQIFWSHRNWTATIIEQVPDSRIVWKSEGQKGYIDGTVTFHELEPELTRILFVLEYHPQGLFEKTGNIWRAQGRRARLEIKHYRRHVMTQVILNPDEVKGWRGEIRDGEVVRADGEAEEQEPAAQEGGEAEAEYEGEPSDEYDKDEFEDGEHDAGEPSDEYDEGEYEAAEDEEGEPPEKYDREAAADYDEEEGAAPDDEERDSGRGDEQAEAPRRRRTVAAGRR
jgi:uncharacterized membrane protein